MKNYILVCCFVSSFFALSQAQRDTIKVFYLGGQSNMQGYGFNKDLPNKLKKIENVYIFQGNPVGDNQPNGGLGKWEELKEGNGTDFSSNGKNNNYSSRFGIELSFAYRLKELYPNDKIAIIKYSRNGSSIDSLAANNFGSWDVNFQSGKGLNQYDFFLKTVLNALSVSDINNDNIQDVLLPSGILWMQGESDSDKTEAIANKYYENLSQLMKLMKAAFHDNDLPIVLGKISESGDDSDGKVWTYGEIIQAAQERFVAHNKNSAIVRETNTYNYSDKYHYTSNGFIQLGNAFANAIHQLTTKINN
ncbi:sialate O-acetylesterase [Flavobacterium sp.]|uniref:sialate O-acetylesterase n=1 Tax=Flavobacterium sp. TaxID=239 RepID=UPI003750C49E